MQLPPRVVVQIVRAVVVRREEGQVVPAVDGRIGNAGIQASTYYTRQWSGWALAILKDTHKYACVYGASSAQGPRSKAHCVRM